MKREVATSKGKMFFMRVAPYRSTENKITGCVITLVDITSQKQGQINLQSTEKQLTMAQQASDAKSDYLSRIAHEIRTPISSLMLLAKNAKKEAQTPDALNADLNRITDTIEYMTSIVTDIAEASLSEHRTGSQSVEPFVLREVLDSIVTMVEPNLKKSDVELEVSVADNFNPKYIGSKTKNTADSYKFP